MRKESFKNRFGLVVGFVLLAFLVFGCGEDDNESTQETQSQETQSQETQSQEDSSIHFVTDGLTDEQIADLIEIEKIMHEALIRWSHLDKSALYDGEFEYMRDEHSFAEYLELPRVKRANTDSVVGFVLTGGQFFDRDSVLIDDIVIFQGPTGVVTEFVNKDMIYFHQGRWIRPTLSQSWEQAEYEERIRLADSAAAAEEAEGYGN